MGVVVLDALRNVDHLGFVVLVQQVVLTEICVDESVVLLQSADVLDQLEVGF